MPLLYLAIAAATVQFVAHSGVYPDGSDTMYHIHRAGLVYRALQNGVLWPAYDPSWYNGVEILRYWPPLTPYFMALCQWAAGGDIFDGYLLFIGVLCYLGAFPWLYIGCRMKRPALGAFLGALWFFMPNNLYALFCEGNLPRALSMVILPLFLYNVMSYLWTAHWRYLPGVAVCFTLMAMCHVGYAGMLALATLLYLLLYAMANKGCWGAVGKTVLALLLGFALDGILLLPSLSGGIMNVDSSETMANYFQSLAMTLNPFVRLEESDAYRIFFYFGLSAFLLAVCGFFLSGRRALPGFAAGLLTCLFTSPLFFSIFRQLPGGQYLWMLRFISIALAMILMSFLRWDTLKPSLIALFCLLLALDVLPSLRFVSGERTGLRPEERFDEISAYALLDRARDVTTQRLAVLNEGAGGALDPYVCTDWRKPTANTFGAGWEAAVTARNIQLLNRAANEGAYLYLFDRALELGNDTVLVRTAVLRDIFDAPIEELDAAAARLGYELLESTEAFRLYHLRGAPEHWGTASTYHALNIGTHPGMALSFPGVEEASSNNLSDYTLEQLSQYDMVYIGDFTYDDRAYAEDLILRLSENGTRVVIVADGIPEDRSTHDQSFLGVRCNAIRFTNGYPELETVDGLLNTDLFPRGYTDWSTVYVEGLDDVWGTVYDNGLSLPFYGTAKNSELVFISLNLPYFHELTHDPTVGALLAHALRMPENVLPERRVVPLTMQIDGNEITVVSPEDDVNTTLAFHDTFVADAPVYERNHLAYVGAGTTHLRVAYAHPALGAAVSLAGLVGIAALAALERSEEKRRQKEAEPCAAES